VRRRLSAAAVLAALLAVAVAGVARADGDPASDVLIGSRVFYPYYSQTSKEGVKQLEATVDAAYAAGFPIRVAVITSPYDLGTVSALWHAPQAYCRFLSLEISFGYKGRLLVVTPNGYGYVDRTKPDAAKLRLIRRVPIGKGPDGLLASADRAVRTLAAAGGVRLPAPAQPTGSGSSTRDIVLIVLAGAGVALLSFLAHRLRRGRRRRPSPTGS